MSGQNRSANATHPTAACIDQYQRALIRLALRESDCLRAGKRDWAETYRWWRVRLERWALEEVTG